MKTRIQGSAIDLRDGKYRRVNHHVKFVTRSAHSAAGRPLHAVSKAFKVMIKEKPATSASLPVGSIRPDLEFEEVVVGGCVHVGMEPVDRRWHTDEQRRRLQWTLQHVARPLLDGGTERNFEDFMLSIMERGLVRTMLSKWSWTETTEYGDSAVKMLPLSKVDVAWTAHALGQQVSGVQMDALSLWNNYDGPSDANPDFKQDCALREADMAPGPGLDLLLEHKFFRRVRLDDGRVYYKTPEVEQMEDDIVSALLATRTHALSSVRDPDPDVGRAPDTKQLAAHRMMATRHVSVLTGIAGTGKSATLSGFLRVVGGGIVVVTPSHASRKVIMRACDGVPRAGFDVVQFTRFGFDRAWGSRRTTKLLRAAGSADDPREFDKDDGRPVSPCDDCVETLVFEEAGMQDLQGVAATLKGARRRFPSLRRVIFCGDPRQLRSVGRGNVLQDLIDGGVAHIELTRVFRSGEAIAGNSRAIVDGRPGDINFDKTFKMVACERSSLEVLPNPREDAGGAPKALPLTKIVDEFMRDRAAGEEAHIIAYMNRENDAINSAILNRLGIIADKRGRGVFLSPGLKVVVDECWFEPEPEPERKPAVHVHAVDDSKTPFELIKSDMFVIDSVQPGTRPGLPVVPLVIPAVPDAADDDSEQELTTKGAVVCASSAYHIVRMTPWMSPGADPVEFVIAEGMMTKLFSVGYSTTIHKMQGAQARYVYVVAVPNCVHFDREALYTATSRSETRCKLFTNDTYLVGIVMKRNRTRMSTFHHKLAEHTCLRMPCAPAEKTPSP
jgi:hypothetical protein